MFGCFYMILDYLFIKSMVWLFWFAIDTFKYMAMAVVSVFVGPKNTIHNLAVSNTERITGVPYTETPALFKVQRVKVIAWMVWAYLYWAFVIVGMTAAWLATQPSTSTAIGF